MLDESRLRIFLAAAASGSFSRAARQCNISQPAVSQNIAELEKSYNIKLFVRSPGSVELTPEGCIFRNYAEKIIADGEELELIFTHYAELASLRSICLILDKELMPWAGNVLLPYISKVCPEMEIRIKPCTPDATGDLRISQKEGVRLAEASPSFADHVLFRLIQKII